MAEVDETIFVEVNIGVSGRRQQQQDLYGN